MATYVVKDKVIFVLKKEGSDSGSDAITPDTFEYKINFSL